MEDCLIVGGGVIGLSLAYELSKRGTSVRVVERGQPGQEASWAGAGLLPPSNRRTARDANEALAGLSSELHEQWATDLLDETGIDTGYRRTGSVHLARNDEAALQLQQMAALFKERDIAAELLSPDDLRQFEPEICDPAVLGSIQAALYLPDESQLRNPRHLRALASACAGRGVVFDCQTNVVDFEVQYSRVVALRTTSGRLAPKDICLCGGAWTGRLAARLGVELPMTPVRGQMVLLASSAPLMRHIINEGRRYIVPRPDGRILLGSTEEEAGFDKRTTASGIQSLLRFGLELVPALGKLQIERTWAGLRPGTPDSIPYVGRVGELENAYIAAGHYRGGLHLSPGTAVVLAQLICGEAPLVDLEAFSPLRFGRQSGVSPSTA